MSLLPQEFYLSTNVVQIAKDLLGKKLISNIGGKITSGIIVETEAYEAPDDLASHAKGFRRSPKNESMYSAPGHSYVYICYGIHDLFNAVTGPEGTPHAVLIRAIEPLEGIETMLKRRKMTKVKKELCNGPGKFTKAMGITMNHDRIRLFDPTSPVQIVNSGFNVKSILSGPRVGMSHHTKQCGHWPYRFRIANNKWASKPDIVKYEW